MTIGIITYLFFGGPNYHFIYKFVNLIITRVGDLVRTAAEKTMCKALGDVRIPYQVFRLYCFECKDHFEWKNWQVPDLCHIGKHKLWFREFARPDIVITSSDKRRTAVIRVDGGIHEKKRVKNNDYFQTIKFNDCGVRVFIVKNEDIEPRYSPTFQPHALALLFRRLLDEPTLYNKNYSSSKYWKEHNRKL